MGMFKSTEPAVFEGKTLADTIYLRNPFTSVIAPGVRRYLVYFVTGNPGLVEYYRTYLTYLYAVLAKENQSEKIVIEVYARSLGGFELVDDAKRKWWQRKQVYNLPQQVEFVEQSLLECSHQLTKQADGVKPKVILIGHSVGAYIAMELLQRHRARLEGVSKDEKEFERPGEPNIVGAICLFPTVMNIAQSASGQTLSTLAKIPLWSNLNSSIGSLIGSLVPYPLLRGLVHAITGYRARALETTTSFLKSPSGIRQAIHMGCDEMAQITADKWDSEVWGAVHPSPTNVPRPQLFFYFGEKDHWVADHTRDELMKCRARGESGDGWKPLMEIDKLGIPHGFCIEHSIPVAEKTKEYVQTIVDLRGEERASTVFSLADSKLQKSLQNTPRASMADG